MAEYIIRRNPSRNLIIEEEEEQIREAFLSNENHNFQRSTFQTNENNLSEFHISIPSTHIASKKRTKDTSFWEKACFVVSFKFKFFRNLYKV